MARYLPMLHRSRSRRILRSQKWWRPQWGAGLPLRAMVVVCMLAFTGLLAMTTVGQQAVSMLRFALGWQHIASQQQQLNEALGTVLQSMGITATAHRLERSIPQRRGREQWQRQTHIVQVPPGRSLEAFAASLRDTTHRLQHAILERHDHLSATHTTVELTLGIRGVPTDIFVLVQPRVSLALRSPPPPSSPARSQVAIVIDDLGWNLEAARALLDLDVPLSFAILPNAPYRTVIAQEARRRGRDILLHLPMEPYKYPHVDPGRPVLLSTMNTSELAAEVEVALAALPPVVGVNNHMGSRLTEDRKAMRAVMQRIKRHNLFFLDSRTSQKSLASQVAREMGVRTAERQVFLDNETETTKIHGQLDQLTTLARVRGNAIGTGHPHPETVQALRHALPGLQQAGIEIVPISRLVQ
jgi:polysaccharide deacetylase 2 family uncharacterized protein YibQ